MNREASRPGSVAWHCGRATSLEAAGRRRGGDLLLIADRRAAITRALSEARAGDVVLLAGKGHEQTIETASGEIPWDEAAVAIEALRALAGQA